MKTFTYTTEITKPMLTITYDNDPTSPREDTNLGLFITNQRRHYSPDKDCYLENLIKETGEQASDIQDHLTRIWNELKEEGEAENYLDILPVDKYEHGNVVYRLGASSGFDSGVCGFYFITKDGWKEHFGDEEYNEEAAEKRVATELETYTQYVNGEVYQYTLYNKDGEVDDCCCGFYEIESMRDFLPADFKDEDLMDYFVD